MQNSICIVYLRYLQLLINYKFLKNLFLPEPSMGTGPAGDTGGVLVHDVAQLQGPDSVITRNTNGSVTVPCAVCRLPITLQRGTYVARLRTSPSKRLFCSHQCAAEGRRKGVED